MPWNSKEKSQSDGSFESQQHIFILTEYENNQKFMFKITLYLD